MGAENLFPYIRVVRKLLLACQGYNYMNILELIIYLNISKLQRLYKYQNLENAFFLTHYHRRVYFSTRNKGEFENSYDML